MRLSPLIARPHRLRSFRRLRVGMCAVGLLAAGCTSSGSASHQSAFTDSADHSQTPPPQRSPSTEPPKSTAGLFKPVTNQQICEVWAGGGPSCLPVTGRVTRSLFRPLRLPHLASGQRCVTTKGAGLVHPGPVRPLIASPHAGRGLVTTEYDIGGWHGAKTLWTVAPTYHGPLLVRGRRLDRTGPMAFGENPSAAWVISGPGSQRQGWPGATWVRSSGCYGFQVDLVHSSYTVTVHVSVPRQGN